MKSAAMALVCGVALGVVGIRSCRERGEVPSLTSVARACRDKDLSCPRPVYAVDDLQASLRYYREALGFRVDWTHGEPAGFASVSRGDGVVFLCDGCEVPSGAWSIMFSPDVDHLHEELRGRGAIIRTAPTDMPWGLREMNVADLDGNVLRVATGIDEE